MRSMRNLVLVAAVLVSACTGGQQLSLDRDLSGLLAARTEATAKNDYATRLTADRGLAELAKSARSAAEERAKAGKDDDSIAAYRVSATAAWKSGDPQILAIANQGSDRCGALKDRQPARDCAFLRAVIIFAAFDDRVENIRRLMRRGGPPIANEQLAQQVAGHVAGMVRDTREARALRRELSANPASNLPPEFDAYLEIQEKRMVCAVSNGTFRLRSIPGNGPTLADTLLKDSVNPLRGEIDPARTLLCDTSPSKLQPIRD